MGTFSLWHWMVVLLIVVLVFGTKKLKNLGADLGGAVKGFKDGMKDGVASGGVQGDGGAAAQQVGRDAPGETIDVQARQKEQA